MYVIFPSRALLGPEVHLKTTVIKLHEQNDYNTKWERSVVLIGVRGSTGQSKDENEEDRRSRARDVKCNERSGKKSKKRVDDLAKRLDH